ncbi:MAG: biotin synthase BioB [Vampirovibrionales bacterium]|nr:biotin synthase BioB [Vampirovibrionales bacterium]
MPPSPSAPITLEQLRHWAAMPLLALVLQAANVHRQWHNPAEIQLCTLSNIKSGNCSEDCAYCPQSVRYNTGIETWDLPTVDVIKAQAQAAKANGSTRFCMGAAWRTPPHQTAMDHVCELVKTVCDLGMEACVTLGMLTQPQAKQLKAAGLTAYNHNIDTSPAFYEQIITTRTFEDRLETLKNVAEAGIQVCCGGILGLGETPEHRLEMIYTLTQLETPPESVPINCLVPVDGTPLENTPPVEPLDLVRIVAMTRLALPSAKIRLSAGRLSLSEEAHALAFLAGANAIFTGETLLTTPNPGENHDRALLDKLGLVPMPA